MDIETWRWIFPGWATFFLTLLVFLIAVVSSWAAKRVATRCAGQFNDFMQTANKVKVKLQAPMPDLATTLDNLQKVQAAATQLGSLLDQAPAVIQNIQMIADAANKAQEMVNVTDLSDKINAINNAANQAKNWFHM